MLRFFLAIYVLLTLISCSAERDTSGITAHNRTMVKVHSSEAELAYQKLITLFDLESEVFLNSIHTVLVDTSDKSPQAPRFVFFYFSVDQDNEHYMSKLLVNKDSVSVVVHMITSDENLEFERFRVDSTGKRDTTGPKGRPFLGREIKTDSAR